MDTSGWIGKSIKLYFQDSEKVLIKEGKIVALDSLFLTLKNSLNGRVETIPIARILRFEEEIP